MQGQKVVSMVPILNPAQSFPVVTWSEPRIFLTLMWLILRLRYWKANVNYRKVCWWCMASHALNIVHVFWCVHQYIHTQGLLCGVGGRVITVEPTTQPSVPCYFQCSIHRPHTHSSFLLCHMNDVMHFSFVSCDALFVCGDIRLLYTLEPL